MLPIHPIGPLKPFACSYRRNGRTYGITLWATSEKHILPGFQVDGVLIATKDTTR